MCYSVPSLLPLPLFCPKEVNKTGPSAGLSPGDLSPLYLPLPFHLPTACGWGDVEDAGKDPVLWIGMSNICCVHPTWINLD